MGTRMNPRRPQGAQICPRRLQEAQVCMISTRMGYTHQDVTTNCSDVWIERFNLLGASGDCWEPLGTRESLCLRICSQRKMH